MVLAMANKGAIVDTLVGSQLAVKIVAKAAQLKIELEGVIDLVGVTGSNILLDLANMVKILLFALAQTDTSGRGKAGGRTLRGGR